MRICLLKLICLSLSLCGTIAQGVQTAQPLANAENINTAYRENDSEAQAIQQAIPAFPSEIVNIIRSYLTYKVANGTGPSSSVYSLLLLPQEKGNFALAMGCGDGVVRRIFLNKDPLERSSFLPPLTGHTAPVTAMQITKDGTLLTAATLEQRSVEMKINQETEEVIIQTSLNKSKEKRSDDRLLEWNLATKKVIQEIKPDKNIKPPRCHSFITDIFVDNTTERDRAAESYSHIFSLHDKDNDNKAKHTNYIYMRLDDAVSPSWCGCSDPSIRKAWLGRLLCWGCLVGECFVASSAVITAVYLPEFWLAPAVSCPLVQLPPLCYVGKELIAPDKRLHRLDLKEPFLVLGYANGEILIQEKVDNAKPRRLKASPTAITALCPIDQTLFVSASAGGEINIWNAKTGACVAKTLYRSQRKPIYAILPFMLAWKTKEKSFTQVNILSAGVGGVEMHTPEIVHESAKRSASQVTLAEPPTAIPY